MLYTNVVNSRVSAFICCIIYPNLLIIYKTGTVRHRYKNKADNVRLLLVFTSFSTVLAKILFFAMAKTQPCFPENFMQIRVKFLCKVANRHTNKQQ